MNARKTRNRQGDQDREVLPEEDRPLVREIMAEMKAYIDQAETKIEDRIVALVGLEGGIDHRAEHATWRKLMPDLEQTLMPWSRLSTS